MDLKKETVFAVGKYPDRLHMLVFEDANELGSEEGDGVDGEEPLNLLDVGVMRVLEVCSV